MAEETAAPKTGENGNGSALKMAGLLIRLVGRHIARTLNPDASFPVDAGHFETGMKALLAAAGEEAGVKEVRFIELSGRGPEWVPSGFEVVEGEEITIIAAGAIWASKLLDLRFGPRVGIWLKIGEEGRIFKAPSEAATIRAPASGPLMLAAKPPGEWADEQGRFDPDYPREGVSGAFRLCVLSWKNGATRGLEKIVEEAGSRQGEAPVLVRKTLERLRDPVSAPDGWRYLWRLGEGEIYRETREGEARRICCETHEDVGILQFPADFPLTDKTRLKWRWKADRLPSDLAEDVQPTHDYLSIAVEFENGQDLTYMWSSRLLEGTIFRCPLPWWDKRETHWVVRSDKAKLGQWLEEEQSLRPDYAKAVGEPPARIVRVWLIAVSVFQHGTGKCEFADIELTDGEKTLKIL